MRKLKDLFSPIGLQHIKLIPTILLEIKNRPEFCMNYITHRKVWWPYILRNGYKIMCQDFDDLWTISEVIFKKCYGKIFPKSWTILDIWANTGISAIYLASKSWTSKIIAYEPFERNYNQIKKQVKLNRLENRIFTHKVWIDKTSGTKKLYIADQSVTPNMYNMTSSDTYVEITTTTIDDIIKDYRLQTIDFIKMDCEWAEFDILYWTSEENIKKIHEIKMEYHDIFVNDKKRNSKYLKSWLKQRWFTITKERIQPHAKNCWFIWCKRIHEK